MVSESDSRQVRSSERGESRLGWHEQWKASGAGVDAVMDDL